MIESIVQVEGDVVTAAHSLLPQRIILVRIDLKVSTALQDQHGLLDLIQIIHTVGIRQRLPIGDRQPHQGCVAGQRGKASVF